MFKYKTQLIKTHPIPAANVQHELEPRKVQRITSSLPDRMRICRDAALAAEPHPDTVVLSIVQPQQQGSTNGSTNGSATSPLYRSYRDMHHFFLPPTPAEVAAYQHDVIQAVRTQDLDTLQRFHAQGRPLKCSNGFGESILHLACRKSLYRVTHYLVQQVGVPVTVCDDYGRSPLHDACWTATPNFDLVDLLLHKCPDLLYIRDRRGFTPLQHVPRDVWPQWNAYLRRKTALFLAPRHGSSCRRRVPSASSSSSSRQSLLVLDATIAPLSSKSSTAIGAQQDTHNLHHLKII